MRYQVVVGNVGTVIDTDDFAEAVVTHRIYCQMLLLNQGRAEDSADFYRDGEHVSSFTVSE